VEKVARRILIVDDRIAFCEGLSLLFQTMTRFVAFSARPTGASRVFAKVQPHISLVGLPFDGDDSLHIMQRLGSVFGSCPKVILCHERIKSACYLDRIGNWGGCSLIRGASSFAEIVSAVDAMVSDSHDDDCPANQPPRNGKRSAIENLTAKEVAILRLLARGLTTRQCSEILNRSESTIDNHRTRMMKKLGIHRSAALVRLAIKEGLMLAED
jgi:DNA-binding NarL/FixJ family response regulator